MGQTLPQIDVSVIIVNYNAFKLLDECLNSLFLFCKNQSLEVIVIDNNSVEMGIEKIKEKYPSVIFIENNYNAGFAGANNQGLKLARGKYILFLNNDTVFIEDTISKVFSYSEKYGTDIFVGCQLLNADLSKQESVVDFPGLWNGFTENLFLYKLFKGSPYFDKYYMNYRDIDTPQEVDVIKGAFMFCTNSAIKKMNGFDERFYFYSEETDLCYRFKMSGGKIIFIPDARIVHYGGESTDKNLWFKFKNQTTGKIQYYQKHFSGVRFAVTILIHFTGLLLRSILFSVAGMFMLNKTIMEKGYYFFKQMFVYPKNKFVT